jgi:hypothetical protein
MARAYQGIQIGCLHVGLLQSKRPVFKISIPSKTDPYEDEEQDLDHEDIKRIIKFLCYGLAEINQHFNPETDL